MNTEDPTQVGEQNKSKKNKRKKIKIQVKINELEENKYKSQFLKTKKHILLTNLRKKSKNTEIKLEMESGFITNP